MTHAQRPLLARPTEALSGTAQVPGDKSMSHRALMLGLLAVGETRVTGLLEGEDVLATAAACRQLGAEVERGPDGAWTVWGRGLGGLSEPADVLDMGNSGTAARLLLGILAGHPLFAVMTGDASLRRRPMGRVTQPLAEMGAIFATREGGRLPLAVTGARRALALSYRLPVASAQVKSAILLAGLMAPGITTVIEPEPTRDHSERMLRYLGATVVTEDRNDGRHILLTGEPELSARPFSVTADPSSAAFPTVAALLLPGSRVLLPGVGTNPLRRGLYDTLLEMGAKIAFENAREEGGEPLADLVIEGGRLKGVTVPAERAPSMIDEYPVLAVAAALAEGPTVMQGLAELRVKESDRLAAVARGLAACGVAFEEGPDSLVVHGSGGRRVRGTGAGRPVETLMDHRIAMAFLVLGLASEQGVAVDDSGFIDTSFPGFAALMQGLGAKLEPA
jgi:3-phosphoshikimate 1-carboxyvinyltransferase